MNTKLKKITFLVIAILSVITLIGGLGSNKFQNLIHQKDYRAAGDTPAHHKGRESNGDGTYRISLDVTGDSEYKTKPSPADVLIVYDVSGSMEGTLDTYVTTTGNDGTQYGLVNGNYVELTRYYGNWYYWANNDWHSYNGTRYVHQTRAAATEKVAHDFAAALLAKNEDNPDTIQMALVTFSGAGSQNANPTHENEAQEVSPVWTSDESFADKFQSNGTSSKLNYGGGTNWEAAMRQAYKTLQKGRDDVPKFVVFITDGAPTFRLTKELTRFSGSGTCYENSNNTSGASSGCSLYGHGTSTYDDLTNYRKTIDEVQQIMSYNSSTDATPEDEQSKNATNMFGIYAFGTEGDLLDDLLYSAYNKGTDRTPQTGNTSSQYDTAKATTATKNYYNAGDSTALNQAMSDIFNNITNAMGVEAVRIDDGTTESVKTTSGQISHLLAVDESSYKYELDMPYDTATNTITRKDLLTGEDIVIRLTANSNGTVTATSDSWTESVTVTGTMSMGHLKYEWTKANNLYDYDPPKAKTTAPASDEQSGAVEWDLASCGTLLNGVTYTVSFDVYPTQETYDLIADLKNGVVKYSELSFSAVGPYAGLDKYIIDNGNGTYSLETNTNANLYYTDNRTDDGEQTSAFNTLTPVATNAEKIKITKAWENALDPNSHSADEVTVIVNKGSDPYLDNIVLNENNEEGPYTETFFIATGLMRVDKEAKTIDILDSGHEYTFKESGTDAYNWELVAETVRPMIINGKQYKLIKIDENMSKIYQLNGQPRYTIPSAMGTDAYYYDEENGDEYYQIDGAVYVAIEADKDNMSTLSATNYRRSSLNIKKTVDGEKANANDEFKFKVHIQDKGATDDQWFSVQNTAGATISVGTIDGAEPQPNGYYVVPKAKMVEGVDLEFKLKNGYNLRFTNLTTQTTYTVEETEMPNNKYLYKEVNSKGTYGSAGTPIDDSATTDTEGKTTGSIAFTNSIYELEYVNEYQETEVSVTKSWDDADNQDGLRGNGATFRLYADGQQVSGVDPKSIAEDGTVTFTGLPRFKGTGANKTEIVYTVKEDALQGYETTPATATTTGVSDGATVTNKHTPETVDVSVTKKWNDANNQDGIRPETVTFTLNGDESTEITLDGTADDKGESSAWVATWTNLPKYANGEEIDYHVTETSSATGYTAIYDDDETATFVEDGGTITNKHTPEETQVSVTKAWDDANNQDGIRPETVTFTLTGSDGSSKTITLNGTADETGEKEAWKAVWENLPKKANGVVIEYKVTETSSSDGYTAVYGSNNETYAVDGGTITNKHTPETVTRTIVKVWEDDNDRDKKRPETLKVTLSNYGTVILDKENYNWTATITDLPKYKNHGEEIQYTWTEDENGLPTGYSLTNTATSTDEQTGAVITTLTNSYTPEVVSTKVTKEWQDANDQDGKRPDSITMTLYDNKGNEVEFVIDETTGEKSSSVELTEDMNWTKTVEGLYKYDQGEEISYHWVEDTTVLPQGYSKTSENTDKIVDQTTKEISYETTIINTYKPETDTITVTKVWEDNNDQDGKRPDDVAFTVTGSDGKTYDATLSGNGKTWTANVTVDKYYNGGDEVTFTVDEENVADYEKSIDNKTLTITNTYEPETDTITVTKVWEDNNDQDGKRPDDVDFTVTGSDGKIYDATLTGNGKTWTAEVEVDKYYNEGTPVTFTVDEETVSEYSKSIDNDTLTITNSYEPETDTITVTKVWEDNNNQDGKRPDDVAFTVTGSDGKTYDATLTGNGKTWTAEVEVDKYYNGGDEVTFTVDEETVSGYSKSIDNDTLTITNSYTPKTTKLTVEKVWQDANDQDGIRKDVNATITLYANGEIAKLKDDQATVSVTTADDWSKTWENLPVYKDGEEITYHVEETMADVDYQKSGDGEATAITASEEKTNLGIITVTNKHTPEKDKITVTKVWEDNNDQDGKRPEDVAFTVTGSDGKTYDATLTGNGKTWTAEVEVDKYYNEGTPVTFTVDEETVSEYSKSIDNDTLTITNSYEPDTDTITVTKVWEDNNDQDGKRPDDVAFTVTGSDGKTYDATLSGNGKTWTANVTVDKYYNGGDEVTFTVDEETVSGYSKSIDNDTLTITNSYTPEKANITVTKDWDDNDDQDGIRKDVNATMTLYANGEIAKLKDDQATVSVTTADNWSKTWENLPVYANGEKIDYKVVETLPDGSKYNKDGDDEEFNLTAGKMSTVEVTNSYTPEETEATVKKEWKDEGDQDGIRPGVLVVTLSNGTEVELSESNQWTATIEHLPKYENQGQLIGYTWSEDTSSLPDGYSLVSNETKGTVTTITNKYTPKTDTITVTKVWEDNNDQDGKRPDDVAFTVTGSDGKTYDATLSGNGKTWTANVTVDKYYNHGEEVTFEVDEEEVAGYSKSIDNDTLTITNSYEPETDKITVTKVWEDAGDQDGKRPDDVAFTVTGSDGKTYDATLSGNGKTWTAEVTVDKYYNHGDEVTFEVDEEEVAGYSKSIDNDTLTITNSYTPKTTSLTVKKVWNDKDDQDGIRKDVKAKITLYANGKKATVSDAEVSVGTGADWSKTWSNLPVYNKGEEITYHVEETMADVDYQKSGDGEATAITASEESNNLGTITVTNSHTPETITIKGEKIWVDEYNVEDLRPTTINVNLKSDGKVINTAIVKEGEDGKWFYTFDSDSAGVALPKYKIVDGEGGKLINYTIEEVRKGDKWEQYYETSIDPKNQYNLINTHQVRKIELTIKKEWIDKDNRYGHQNSIDVELSCKVENKEYCGGSDYTYTLDKDNNWTVTVGDLPKTDGEGHLLNYTVKEVSKVLDYSTSYDYENAIVLEAGTTEITTTITNTYTPQTRDIEGTKSWEDEDDNDAIRPKSITIEVFDGISDKAVASKEVTPDEDGNWNFKFEKLPIYANGEKIEYELKEKTVDGYTTIQDGYNFTNYHNPETVQFSVHKVWNDNNNNDGKRIDEITVRLMADGVEKESAVLSDENDWSHTFKPYKKYKNVEGKQVAINYEIIEDEVADYKPTLSEKESVTTTTKPEENGTFANQTNTNTSFDLTNTHEDEKTSITITKTWDDDDNAAGARPNTVTVYIYADNNLFKTVVLSKDNGWAVTIKDLAVYKGGKKIVYTITEKEVTDYTAVIEGFNITNIYDGTGKVEHEDYENPPKTDINNEYLGYTITLSTLLGGAIILRKRFN